jgi:hypothetical protein
MSINSSSDFLEQEARAIISVRQNVKTIYLLIYYLGFCELATKEQIIKYLENENQDLAKDVFEDALRAEYIKLIHKTQMRKVKNLKHLLDLKVYSVTKKGLRLLGNKIKGLAFDINRRQEPDVKIIRHSLIVAESILKFQTEHEIIHLKSENRLRSDLMMQEWKSFQKEMKFTNSHSLSDYQIVVMNKTTKDIKLLGVEAAVKYSAKDLKNKESLFWFTDTEKEINRIKMFCGEVNCQKVELLSEEIATVKTTPKQSNKLSSRAK